MKTTRIVGTLAIALAMSALGAAASAQGGDIYSRLMQMREMDRNKDGMISKEEFLAMISKAWDMHVAERKIGGKMTPEQLRELEKVLGRSLGAASLH